MSTEDILELAALYTADNGLPLHVNAAFIEADMTPPSREAGLMGFTSTQSNVISAYYAKHDPNGTAADRAKFDGADAGK